VLKPNEEVLRAITNLKGGTQFGMFEILESWIKALYDNEIKVAIFEPDIIERNFAAGRVQILTHVMNAFGNAESELIKIENGKKLNK